MAAPDRAIAAARAYEDLHVPALFAPFAPKVTAAAGVGPGQRVLDVACGTGVLARQASAEVGERGVVAGVDPGPGMLAVARELSPSVDWRQGTADAIPFDDASFDAVVSQFGMMFFPDGRAAVREMLRVLKPGGRLAVAVWDSLGNIEGYLDVVMILDRVGGRAAGDALRAPFVLGDRDAFCGTFREAGAADVQASTQYGTARFPSVHTMVEAELRGWLPIMGVQLTEVQIESVLAEAEQVLAPHVQPDGTVEFGVRAHVVTARRA